MNACARITLLAALLSGLAMGCGHYGPPVRPDTSAVKTVAPGIDNAAETLDPECEDEEKP